MKFSIKDFFSFLRIWSHLLKKSLTKNFIFCLVLKIWNGWLFMQPQARVLIQTDAPNKGWGAVCRRIKTGGQWSKKEQDLHMNQLELLAIKFATLTFGKMWKISAIHIQVDNMISLIYLLKMGGTKNPEPMQISNEIWEFLSGQEITTTAKHLPGISIAR